MKIEEYQPENGNVTFMVDSDRYQKIVDHLRSKKLRVTGHYSGGKFSDIFVGATIDRVNDALKDFTDNAR